MAMVELRTPGAEHWYNPQRDLVSQTVQILREASCNMVEELLRKNHAFADLAARHNLTEQDFVPAAAALAKFVILCADTSGVNSIEEAIHRSGIIDLPEPVLQVTFSLIAQNLLGRFYALMRRSALPELIVPTNSKEALLNMAEVMGDLRDLTTSEQRSNRLKDIEKWAKQPALNTRK